MLRRERISSKRFDQSILRRIRKVLFAALGIASSAHGGSAVADSEWWVARGEENGKELIFRVRATFPDDATVARYSWLAVIEWDFIPTTNGMPELNVSRQIYEFEDLLETKVESTGVCIQAFARTGNGKKEWNYYVADREAFMASFNNAMNGKERFPIQIHFYSDSGWSGLREMHTAAGR